jgi:DNA-binding FadR family transcriptional regulator
MQHDRNPRFHRIITEITANQVYIIVMEILMEIHAFRMNQFKVQQGAISEIVSQHGQIIAAFKNKDSKMAFEKMKEHVLAVHDLHKELDTGNP